MFRSPPLAGVLDPEADEGSLAFALVDGNNGRVWESVLVLSTVGPLLTDHQVVNFQRYKRGCQPHIPPVILYSCTFLGTVL